MGSPFSNKAILLIDIEAACRLPKLVFIVFQAVLWLDLVFDCRHLFQLYALLVCLHG